jgi:O-antigen/teichoic acid export membrane protein
MLQTRLAKVLVLSSGQALTVLVGILSAAVLARVFSQTDYASYRQTILAYTFAVPFVMMGFDRALYYFLPCEEKRSRGILAENLIWLLGAGALLSLFLLLGGNRLLATRFNNPDLVVLLLFMVPYPLLMLPAASLAGCLMACNRAEQIAGFNVGSRLLMFLAVVVPCLLWSTASTAIIGTVLGAGITTAAALILMFRACNAGDWRPTWQGLRQQVQFSLPLGLSGLVGTVAQSVGQVIVAARCPPETFAIFVNGAMEIPLISMVTGSITSVVVVDYARYYREGNLDQIVKLIHRAMTKSGLILLPVMAFFLCMAPETMCLVFGQRYEASAIPFRVFLLMLPIRTLTFGAILQATGNSRHVLIYAVIFLIANTLLTWLALELLGPLLSPVGSVLADIGTLPYLVYVIKRILKCSVASLFPWADMAKVAGASFISIPLLLALKAVGGSWPNPVLLLSAGLVFGAVTAGIFAFLGLVDFAAMAHEIELRMRRLWQP